MRHPIQPVEKDQYGTYRFKKNAIVEFLLENGGHDLNKLGKMDFSREDHEQFAQLIGYSVGGFALLSYASGDVIVAAEKMAEGKSEQEARIESLEESLAKTRAALRDLVPELFRIHPDDLVE
jgi:hypothetical protein